MSPYAVITAVCLAGIIVEALRVSRPGQSVLAAGPDGRYRAGAAPVLIRGRAFAVHIVPLLPSGPTFRFGRQGSGLVVLPVSREVLDAGRARLDAARRICGRVLPACWAMLLYLVVLVPATLLLGLVAHGWIVLAGALLLIQGGLLSVFWFSYRALHPGETWQCVHHLVAMLFFPPAGVFACDRLVSELTDDIHPLTASLVLLSTRKARALVADQLRQWKYPVAGDIAPPDAEVIEALFETVTALGPEFEDILAPPERDGAISAAFCPRCLAQFTGIGGACPDCPGIDTVRFRPSLQ